MRNRCVSNQREVQQGRDGSPKPSKMKGETSYKAVGSAYEQWDG